MIFKKIAGWLLLIIGIFIIFFSLYSSYNIFTAKTEAPEIFIIPEEVEEETAFSETGPLFNPQAEMSKIMESKLGEMFPSHLFSKLLNLIAWSIFAGILIFGGTQIGSLGIKLIKK